MSGYPEFEKSYACSGGHTTFLKKFLFTGTFFAVFWLVANVIGWSGFVIVLIFLSKEFAGYPTTVLVDVKPATSQQFPAVSVCNMNRITGQLAKEQVYFQVGNLFVEADLYPVCSGKYSIHDNELLILVASNS